MEKTMSKPLTDKHSSCKLSKVKVHISTLSHHVTHMSGVHCHVCASSTSGCAFVYFTVQYYRVQ